MDQSRSMPIFLNLNVFTYRKGDADLSQKTTIIILNMLKVLSAFILTGKCIEGKTSFIIKLSKKKEKSRQKFLDTKKHKLKKVINKNPPPFNPYFKSSMSGL